MPTSTELTVNEIKVPKDDEQALLDAYRQDVNEMGDVGLLARKLGLTINLYGPSPFSDLLLYFSPGKKIPLGSKDRAALSQPKQSLGKGIPIVDLFYNERWKRYETLEKEKNRFAWKVGGAGDKEDSLCHCLVKIKEPDIKDPELANRIASYKADLAKIKDLSDDNIRARLKENTIPGSKVEDALRTISLNREKTIKNLLKLVRHLREELDTVEPPQRDRSKYAGEFQVTRQLVENLEYDYERKIKDFTHKQLVEEYARIQQHRLKILKEGYKKPQDWQTKEVYKKKFIKGSEDYKAVALAAILDDTTLDPNERFRLATGLITSIDPEKLKRAYMRIRGAADLNKLETDIEAKFYVKGGATSPLRMLDGLTKYFSVGEGHKLQFPYLKSLLETGEQTPSARLAIKLGLLYRGAEVTKLTQEQKDEIRKLVEEEPGELAGLANVDAKGNLVDTSDEFLQAVYAKLKKDHSGVLGELQTKLRQSVKTTPITGIDIETIAKMKITDGAAQSLIRLMYNKDKKELRKVGSSWIDTAPLKKKILEWIKGCTQEELTKFIKAGEDKKASKPPTPYQMVWSLIDSHMVNGIEVGNWKQYFSDMAEARLAIGHEPEAMRPFYEVEAFLKYKKSRGLLLSHKEQKETLAKVLNMLSASDGWDPKAKLAALMIDHPDLKRREDYEKYKEDPALWLEELLQGAGVDAEGREQVNLLLYAGGTYNGDEATDSARNIDNYLSLKRKAHRGSFNQVVHGLSTENILTTIGKVKPGSLEHWLLRKDTKLLTKIRETLREEYENDPARRIAAWGGIYQTLDLSLIWENLNAPFPEGLSTVMPEPASKDDLKTFKNKYKDDEIKKKLWAGKYTLTYSLAKDQSLFNMSDRKELLKVVYDGQLEGYQGDELIAMLDGIDPSIRNSLTKDPPGTWTNHEKAAHALLKKFLIDKQDIDFKDFLSVAKGLFNNNYSVIDFAVNDLAPEKSATLWCSKSYHELKTWSETRLQKTMELHGLNARTTGAPSAEAKELEAEIADLDKKIGKHEFKIDDEIKGQLQGLTHEGKAVEFERKLKQKIGETMLSEPEKFKDLHVPPFALSGKGTRLLAAADIDYQHYLTTGVGYHRFSVSGLESYAEMSNFMRDLWKTASAQPTGTAEEREREEQALLATLKKSHEALLGSLDQWKDKQDEYTKRIVEVVKHTLGVAMYVALAASGIGTVAFVAMGPVNAALNTLITRAVEAALSRKGDVLPQEVIKDAMVSAVAAVPAVLATVDYGEVPGLKKIIDNHIGSALVKGQISAISKAIVGGMGNMIAAGGSGDFELSSKAFKDNIVKQLQAYNLTQPQIYKTVLTGLSFGLSKAVTNSIKTGVTGMDDAAFKKLDKDKQAELTGKFKPQQVLFKSLYKAAMADKLYDLLAKGPAAVANLPFADDVTVDKNKLEEEKKQLAIANSLVEVLAEKGLRVDTDFDYGDAEKLIEQIAGKMPGVEVTPEEIRALKAEVDAKFTEKQATLTDEEKKLTEAEQKALLLAKAKEERLTEKKAPWKEALNAMKTRFEKECDAIKAEAEKQAEKDSKEQTKDIKVVMDGNAVTETIGENTSDDKGTSRESAKPGDNDIDVVALSFATRLYGKKSKKNREAEKKKVEAKWRRHREKKEAEAKEAVGAA